VRHTAARSTPELFTGAAPSRDSAGVLSYPGFPSFHPNLTPEEVLRGGAFGGSYFRPIASGVTGKVHAEAWRELPPAWVDGLSTAKHLASPTYHAEVNKFGVKSGQDLRDWEGSGWITAQDPLGWFHWYTRFHQGRRSFDDERQVSRWGALAGDKGRWKRNLIAKVAAAGAAFDDPAVSPVVRQTLWHWGYALSEKDCAAYTKLISKGASAPYIKKGSSAAGGGGASSAAAAAADSAAAAPAPARKRKRSE
jgi:hypothetical protein